MTDPYPSLDEQIVAAARDAEPARHCLYTLCDTIGPRFAGTGGDRAAAGFIQSQFEAAGLEGVHLEPIDITAWQRGQAATLTAVGDSPLAIACYDMPYSGSTGPQGVTAEVVDVGDGSKEAMDPVMDQLAGRIALLRGTKRHRMTVYAHCVAAGAVGLVIAHKMPGMHLHTGAVTEAKRGTIPAVSVGHEVQFHMLRLMDDAPLKLHLTTDSQCVPGTTANVVGELPGQSRPDEFVYVGGHFDSHEIGPCAYDNAAGAVVTMEVARLLAPLRDRLQRTVRFVAFAGEEIGLIGSEFHTAQHEDDLARTRLMFNFDMPGVSSPWTAILHRFPEFADYLPGLREALGEEIKAVDRTHNHSDHYPFVRRGVPALAMPLGREGLDSARYYHTAADTPEKIPHAGLTACASVAARIILRACNDEHWPTRDR